MAAAAVAALTLMATATVTAQGSRFPDVGPDDPHYEDIAWASDPARGYFGGFADGTFRPDRDITPEQMAKVLSRLPDRPMARAEFASLIVGGLQRMRDRAAAAAPSTTTTAPPRAESKAWAGSCVEMYAAMVSKAYNEQAEPEDYDFTPLEYSATRDTLGYGRFDVYSVDITGTTGWYIRFATPTMVLCQGEAKLDNNQEIPIIIWSVFNTDGDHFFGYRFPAGGHPACQEMGQKGGTTIGYNIMYLYDPARDADGDNIMCDSVLGEELQAVGRVAMRGPLSLGSVSKTLLTQGGRFPDVRPENPHYADMEWASSPARGYFGGFADGTFRPDRDITPEQMAKVLSRLPDRPMARAEFASFIVGGLQRMRDRAAAATTAAPTTTTTAENGGLSQSITTTAGGGEADNEHIVYWDQKAWEDWWWDQYESITGVRYD